MLKIDINLKTLCFGCHYPDPQLFELNADLEEKMNDMKCDMKSNDPVNHPDHYTQGGKEVIEIIQEVCSIDEFVGYCKGNILKYLARRNFKGFYKQDLQKADWYLDRLLNCAHAPSPTYCIHSDAVNRQNLPDEVRDSCRSNFIVEWYVTDAYMFAMQNNWANASHSLKTALEMI
nr:MAG TPA: nucelotide kinase [Caudoviricetes sp.]